MGNNPCIKMKNLVKYFTHADLWSTNIKKIYFTDKMHSIFSNPYAFLFIILMFRLDYWSSKIPGLI